ncbi:DDE-type integrase/transposase/recombinase [Aggregatibacter actinomycetemcomitans]|uniref:DDE-type integrase/transposase/recombinase n=1 Tax=Aggregatibacter actinomycetemcomitans TaxID=714 RepID=UPI0021B0CE8B|nr:hypothetical protein [Aggregatibacter actinomycetemcomitans]
MTALQLKPRYPRPTFYRKPVKTFADNWLNQRFNVQAKNQVWAGDITYVYTAEGRLYLAVVIDLYSRQIRRCVNRRVWRFSAEQAKRGLLFHSDRGAGIVVGHLDNVRRILV